MRYWLHVLDYVVSRYLAYRGRQHLLSGCPPIAALTFDHIGHEINLKGRYEGADLDKVFHFLQKYHKLAGVAVDVGGNIGNHALYFSKYFESVVSLEPNPRLFELLSFNVNLRGNIRPLNIGASDINGPLTLVFDPGNWGGGSLTKVPAGAANANSFMVTAKRLDDVDGIWSQAIGLMKIDVEGHELQVLRGAERLIRTWHPTILFEQQSWDIDGGSSAVVTWLRERGYSRFLEVRSTPGFSRAFPFPGRRGLNALLRIVVGERKKVVPITKFVKVFYPMIIALP